MSESTASLVADDHEGDDFPHAGAAGYDPEAARDTDTHAAYDRDTQADRPTRRRASSRKQEERAVKPVHDERGETWDLTPQFNQELPPLEGNVQLFVRTTIQGQTDYQSVRKALRAGWRPRSKDTVPEGFFPDTMRLSVDTDFGDVVCNGDRILMERPKRLDDRDKAEIAAQNRDMNSLVMKGLSGQTQGASGLVVGAQGQLNGRGFQTGRAEEFQFD